MLRKIYSLRGRNEISVNRYGREKFFRLQVDRLRGGIRGGGTGKLAGATECGRKAVGRERRRVRKWAGIVTAAGLRGPDGRDAKQRGATSLLSEKGKAASCHV